MRKAGFPAGVNSYEDSLSCRDSFFPVFQKCLRVAGPDIFPRILRSKFCWQTAHSKQLHSSHKMSSALFKASTAALSSRSLARTAPRSIPAFSRRHYSTDTIPEQDKEHEKPDGTSSDIAEKLKAKEAEVVDLTVSLASLAVLLRPDNSDQGRLRYLQADFLNLQRNSAREKEQTRDFAITKFAGDLLETVDVLAIALKTTPSTALSKDSSEPLAKTHAEYLQDLHQGVEMTHRLLLQTLFKYHVKPFDPTGGQFDPNFHEAVYQAPIPDKEPGTVVDCQKTGYTIKDRVLRAARVGVAQGTSS